MSDVPFERDPLLEPHLESVLRAAFGRPPPTDAARPAPQEIEGTPSHYRILGEIARGGMGVILRGHDRELDREVALKVLREDLAGEQRILERFVEEARIGGQLQHPGIVPVYELGRMADRRPYFAMKLIRGRTLAALLADDGAAERERGRLLAIFEQVCQTMAFAHSCGVIHRDLKPSNVMVGSFGEVQIVDWGLAKALRRAAADRAPEFAPPCERTRPNASSSDSVAGQVMGTPAYMPPEQARGEVDQIDERSDVFALGAILCQILTGRPPYTGSEPALRSASAAGALEEAHARLHAVAGEEPELVALCTRCLARNRDARPAHAGEVAAAIRVHFSSVQERARAAQVAAAAARVKAEEERKARKLTLALATTIVLSLAIGLSAWLWMQRQHRLRQAATDSRIDAALDLAALAYGRASSASDLARWQEALSEVDRAQLLLEGGEPGAEREQRAHELAGRIHSEAEVARRREAEEHSKRTLLARLLELRTPEGLGRDAPDRSRVDADYVAAFAAQGLDLDRRPVPESAEQFRARDMGVEAALALDEWAALRRRAGQPEAAERLTQVALLADPDAARGRLRRALSRGDSAEIIACSRGAALEGLPVATLSLLGSALAGLKADSDALRVLHIARQLEPEDYVSNVYMARLLWDRDYQEAARCYASALAARPDDPLVIREFGWLLDNYLHEPARAIELYRRVLARRPGDASLHVVLGHALLHQGDVDAAMASYTEAMRLDPERQSARLCLLRCQARKGELDSVIADCRVFAARYPGLGGWNSLLGGALRERGDLEGAKAAYGLALGVTLDDAEARDGLRQVLAAEGDYDGALDSARENLRIQPDALLGYYDLGLSISELLDVGPAIRDCRQALDADPASPTRRAMLGILLEEQGQYSESLFQFGVADQLGARLSSWTVPSENRYGAAFERIHLEHRSRHWLEEAQRRVQLEGPFEQLLQGSFQPASVAEAVGCAELALRRDWTVAAAGLLAKLVVADPGTDSRDLEDARIRGACAAASAGAGHGLDAGALGPAERALWSGRAAEWMDADLELRERQAASRERGEWLRAIRALGRWRHEAALDSLRERAGWTERWTRVAALEARIRSALRERGR